MKCQKVLPAIIASLCLAQSAWASVDLVAIGHLSGQIADRSHETAAPLENGVAGNLLGGMGSGIAYAGGNTFLAVPDRGPNAVSYNSAIDDTASYIPRFQTLRLKLTPNSQGTALPFSLTPKLLDTTLLSSSEPLVYGTGVGLGVGNGAPALNAKNHTYYFSGRSDNFDLSRPSTYPRDARLDSESIRVSNDGERVYISDEYGPYIYEFDRHSGRRLRSFQLPIEFAVNYLSPQGDVEISGNTMGRVANKGMEGLAITPNGRMLIGAMQSPLLQDGGTNGSTTRIITIDIATGLTHQYAYQLTNIGTAAKPKYPTISEIVAVNDHELLVDERDGKGRGDDSTAAYKKIYHIDLTNAADVTGISGQANLVSRAVPKTLFLDVVAALASYGINPNDIPAKIEGMAFGQDVKIGGKLKHTLVIANDNDFIGTVVDTNHPAGIDNPNQFFVFAFDQADLPKFEPQHLLNNEDGDDD
jgi:hypothetical protein